MDGDDPVPQPCNGARPKTKPAQAPKKKRSRKILKKGCFLTNINSWLWYKSEFPEYHKIPTKYKCKITEGSMENNSQIKITAKPIKSSTPERHLEAEECAEELNREVESNQKMYKLKTKTVEWLYFIYDLFNFIYPKQTHVCHDLNDGVVIIGPEESDVQLAYDALAREYDIPSGDYSPTTTGDAPMNGMNVSVIGGEDDSNELGTCTKVIQISSQQWQFLEVFRKNDLIKISIDKKVTMKIIMTSEEQGLKLKGLKYNVGRASDKIVGLLSELDEVKIQVMPLPGAESDMTDVIESMIAKYKSVLFVHNDSLIHIIGAKEQIHQAQQELHLKFDQIKLSHTEITQNHKAFPLSKSKPKRERKLLKPTLSAFDKGSIDEITFQTKFGQKIHIVNGNITKLAVGAVVNAANCKLSHAGGVAGAIRKAAGPKLQPECSRYIENHGPLPTGGVYTSKAYNMPCQYIIHVVGPRWSDYPDKTQAMDYLRQCFTAVLDEAGRLNVSSIAVPAVGAGIYGSPLPTVAQMMVEGVKIFIIESAGKPSVHDIVLVDKNKEILKLLKQEYQKAVGEGYVTDVPAERDGIINRHLLKCGNRQDEISPEALDSLGEANGYLGQMPSCCTEGNHASCTLSGNKSHSNDKSNERKVIDNNQTVYISNSTVTAPAITVPENASLVKFLPEHEDTEKSVGLVMQLPGAASNDPAEKEKNENCAICMETPTDKVVLRICKHVFCKDCIDNWFKNKPICPNCGQIYGEMKGDQPEGSMTVNRLSIKLEGFNNSSGTIEIKYNFPGGIQQACNPNPGSWYRSTRRTAYLPDNEEGKHVLGLLRRAFDAKLIFTIGRSTTTGRDDQITWNDIHHKTNVTGGPNRFGYPDATYLLRVQEELAAKGIK